MIEWPVSVEEFISEFGDGAPVDFGSISPSFMPVEQGPITVRLDPTDTFVLGLVVGESHATFAKGVQPALCGVHPEQRAVSLRSRRDVVTLDDKFHVVRAVRVSDSTTAVRVHHRGGEWLYAARAADGEWRFHAGVPMRPRSTGPPSNTVATRGAKINALLTDGNGNYAIVRGAALPPSEGAGAQFYRGLLPLPGLPQLAAGQPYLQHAAGSVTPDDVGSMATVHCVRADEQSLHFADGTTVPLPPGGEAMHPPRGDAIEQGVRLLLAAGMFAELVHTLGDGAPASLARFVTLWERLPSWPVPEELATACVQAGRDAIERSSSPLLHALLEEPQPSVINKTPGSVTVYEVQSDIVHVMSPVTGERVKIPRHRSQPTPRPDTYPTTRVQDVDYAPAVAAALRSGLTYDKLPPPTGDGSFLDEFRRYLSHELRHVRPVASPTPSRERNIIFRRWARDQQIRRRLAEALAGRPDDEDVLWFTWDPVHADGRVHMVHALATELPHGFDLARIASGKVFAVFEGLEGMGETARAVSWLAPFVASSTHQLVRADIDTLMPWLQLLVDFTVDGHTVWNALAACKGVSRRDAPYHFQRKANVRGSSIVRITETGRLQDVIAKYRSQHARILVAISKTTLADRRDVAIVTAVGEDPDMQVAMLDTQQRLPHNNTFKSRSVLITDTDSPVCEASLAGPDQGNACLTFVDWVEKAAQ